MRRLSRKDGTAKHRSQHRAQSSVSCADLSAVSLRSQTRVEIYARCVSRRECWRAGELAADDLYCVIG
jgi:hypothetical protein